jgi:hypothetical protein
MPKLKITKERLEDAGLKAAEKVRKDMERQLKVELEAGKVTCSYVGTVEEDAPLHSTTRVAYEWGIKDVGKVKNEIFVGKVLHASWLVPPYGYKTPLLVCCLPEAVTTHRAVPGMLKYEKCDVACRAIAVAMPRENDDYETTYINVGGRRVEHIKCAHINGDIWLVHPGGTLHPKDLFKTEVQPDSKKAKLNGPTQKIEVVRCNALGNLMAYAHWQAEMEKSTMEDREPDLAKAEELFLKDPFKWTKTPKQAFALWSAKRGEGWEQRLSEVNLHSLSKSR